jgi:hypothetical protein
MKSTISKLAATVLLAIASFASFGQGDLDFSQCTNLFDAIDVYSRSDIPDKPDSLKSGAEKEIERFFRYGLLDFSHMAILELQTMLFNSTRQI